MDSFLTKIYHEERTKTAGAELDRYLEDLPTDVLLKIAVAGTPHPELPDSLPGGELDRMMKAVSEHVNKEHLSAVPTRKETSSVSTVSFQGEGKQPVENQDDALRFSGSKGQMKTAGVTAAGAALVGKTPKGILGHVGKYFRGAVGDITGGKHVMKGGFATRKLKIPGETAAQTLSAGNKEIRDGAFRMAKGVGKIALPVAGAGAVGAVALGKKKESGMAKECSAIAVEKAKIAMRSFKAVKDASPQIKRASVALAGKTIAQLR